MIVFNNISLKRGQTELLENATATINPKQKVGLVGKNGCGKSSLFALLKKELTPEGGEVNLSIQLAGILGESRNASIGYSRH